jgi:hypothetical protein
LGSLGIFEVATRGRGPGPGMREREMRGNRAREEIVEIAMRIAHLGILHWRVWAPLAYLVDSDLEELNGLGECAIGEEAKTNS